MHVTIEFSDNLSGWLDDFGRGNSGRINIQMNQRSWNQFNNYRKDLLMRLLSNVDGMDTGDDRRDSMHRIVNERVGAALNAINQYLYGKSSKNMVHIIWII